MLVLHDRETGELTGRFSTRTVREQEREVLGDGAAVAGARHHQGVKARYRSRAGNQALDLLRRTYERVTRAPLPKELPLAFALTGSAVLDGRSYQASLRSGSFGDSGSADGGGGDSGCSA